MDPTLRSRFLQLERIIIYLFIIERNLVSGKLVFPSVTQKTDV